MYEMSEKHVSAEWHYNDTESDVVKAWCAVGTYPYAEDITAKKELNISSLKSNGVNVASITSSKMGNSSSHSWVCLFNDTVSLSSLICILKFLNMHVYIHPKNYSNYFKGKPNIISIWAENSVGLISKKITSAIVIDESTPTTGSVVCPEYIQVYDGIVSFEHKICNPSSGGSIEKSCIRLNSI